MRNLSYALIVALDRSDYNPLYAGQRREKYEIRSQKPSIGSYYFGWHSWGKSCTFRTFLTSSHVVRLFEGTYAVED